MLSDVAASIAEYYGCICVGSVFLMHQEVDHDERFERVSRISMKALCGT